MFKINSEVSSKFESIMTNEFPSLAKSWGMSERINRRLGCFKGCITVYCNTKSPKYNVGKFRSWLNSRGIDVIFMDEYDEYPSNDGWEAVILRPLAF